MNPYEIQLERVFTVCPSYPEYINRESADPKATKANWVQILSQYEIDDVRAVVTDIVNGKASPKGSQFDKADQLPFTIVDRARVIANARAEVVHTAKLKEAGRLGGAYAYLGKLEIGRLAITCGAMSKARAITREENKIRMDELFAWRDGGPRPEWIDDAMSWSKRNERRSPFRMPSNPTARQNWERQQTLLMQANDSPSPKGIEQ